jgi:hypothetical protein
MERAITQNAPVEHGLITGNGIPAQQLKNALNILVFDPLKMAPMSRKQAGIKVGILFLYVQGIITNGVNS